jgi:hypothetical protein
VWYSTRCQSSPSTSLATLDKWHFARYIVPLVLSTTFHQIHLDFWLTYLLPAMYRPSSFLRCERSLRVKHVQEYITHPTSQWATIGISPIHVRYSVLSLNCFMSCCLFDMLLILFRNERKFLKYHAGMQLSDFFIIYFSNVSFTTSRMTQLTSYFP